ncbi:MAG: YceI family protein [Armatimonadetes bacterium]|nr:YceI family protein [Armatimonadota bacterium]
MTDRNIHGRPRLWGAARCLTAGGRRAVLLFTLALLTAPALAETFEIDPVHSNVGFRIRHLVSRVSGSFNQFEGTITFDEKRPAKSSVSVTMDAASIDTRNTRRDDHLRGPDFFDAAKHPKLTFRSRQVKAAGKGRFKVLGDLTMHGVTKPVTLDVEYGGQTADPQGGKRVGFSATTRLNRKDYGIIWNRVLDAGGTVLGDEVEINLDIEAIVKK